MNKVILFNNSKRVLSTLLLFSFINVFTQQISIINKNKSNIEVGNNKDIFLVSPGQTKNISSKDINGLTVNYTSGNNLITKFIPLFLDVNQSLTIIFSENSAKSIEFKGDHDVLEDLIVNQQHYILYKNIVKYQDIYYKMNSNSEFINFSEIVLFDYLNKIKKLNNTYTGNNEIRYKIIENYVINDWVASLFMVFTGAKSLDNKSKDLTLYYYNKYIKKGFEECEYKEKYSIISELAKYINQLKIDLQKYPIIVNTDDDSVNQYLPKSCQKYYFINSYLYYNHMNNPKKDYYKNILKEKFYN
ncbi:hypothetical protein [Chryseobacterium taichungense]|uniref:hypothetical protein n=1 Tax=Chryseobacterium taichungense TaxID=295069 RepID=UPI0028AF7D80|nr:hypothetical protein [Chryseobacterium taichungense]